MTLVEMCKKLFTEMQKPEHKLHHLLPPAHLNIRPLRKSLKYSTKSVHKLC